MKPIEIFESRLVTFLKDNPKSNASKTLKIIKDSYPQQESCYFAIDEFCFRIGIGFGTIPYIDGAAKQKVFRPYIRYYPDNKIEEKKNEEDFSGTLLPLKSCYELLAKEVLYRLMRIPNLTEMLESNTE